MPSVVSRGEWLEARKRLLAEEKAFDRQRDALSAKKRALPWVRIDESYPMIAEDGPTDLAGLFGRYGQLVVYHFMFAPDWKDGCKSCSFWADNFDGLPPHLAARDTAFAAVSRAPIETLATYRRRMGWRFRWVSSSPSTFNRDLGVSFEPGQPEPTYNYAPLAFDGSELPGISVFAKQDGAVYHTYSTYARGLDLFNAAYHYLDVVPKGRDEGGDGMFWVRHRDRYGVGPDGRP